MNTRKRKGLLVCFSCLLSGLFNSNGRSNHMTGVPTATVHSPLEARAGPHVAAGRPLRPRCLSRCGAHQMDGADADEARRGGRPPVRDGYHIPACQLLHETDSLLNPVTASFFFYV